jgi:hypothetical protein
VNVNGTLVEDKMRRFKGESAHFSFNKCPIYTHDGASAKFSTYSQEMDNSVRCSRKMRRNINYAYMRYRYVIIVMYVLINVGLQCRDESSLTSQCLYCISYTA